MNDEALRIHSFKANSKVFQQKFTLSQAFRADANPKGTLFKEAFRSYLMIFKCKDISDGPCTGDVVGLSARKLGTV